MSCPKCGKPESHFVPPSMGEEGFFLCERETVKVEAPRRPAALPRCEHGGRPGWCIECQRRDDKIRKLVQPLADEFWDHRGARDVEHLLLRAYRMGMEERDGSPD
jgi:hypothetical protein